MVFGVRCQKFLFRVKGNIIKMTENTKKRKLNKKELLAKLQKESRFNIWLLGRWGYSVEIVPSSYATNQELDWTQIYRYESFRIIQKGNCILTASYLQLRNFSRLVKRYRHRYGAKNIHSYTDELLAQL